MIPLLMLALSAVLIATVGRLYSHFLSRHWGEDANRLTPAMRVNDGRDYVPTPTPVVFAHHFASIAGAGPIVGPVLALCFGWGPALAWVLLGGLFIGGVHDYLAAFMSIRNGGQSVATIARRLLGRGPFVALIIFLVLSLGLVTASFLNISATALVSMLELGRMRLPDGQTFFRVVQDSGVQKVVIGGVASMSVVVITALAPIIGWMYIRKQVAVWKCSLAAILVCGASILIGVYLPIAFPANIEILGFTLKGVDLWKIILGIYTLVAAGVPVWIFLQSRDFINVHILYAGILMLVVILVVGSLRGIAQPPEATLPVLDIATGTANLGWLWPGLFITIACGAVSGFHSLCAGGTTCKQLKTESATRAIGYWGMLLETLLAVTVIGVLVLGTNRGFYMEDVFPAGKDNNPVLGFAFAVGRAGYSAFGLPIAVGALAGMLLLEGFVITTLDTAVRLNRYLIEEIWQEFFGAFDVFAGRRQILQSEEIAEDSLKTSAAHREAARQPPKSIATRGPLRAILRFLSFYWVNSGIAVALMLWMAFSGGILQLWKLFATSNQLLAAFVLGLGSIWLLRNGRKAWYVLVPALLMLLTTFANLIVLLSRFIPRAIAPGQTAGNPTLLVADAILLALTVYLAAMGTRELLSLRREQRPS